MPREEMLDELTDIFPCKRIYNFDEQFRYDTDRALLMDEVLEGTFEAYVRVEKFLNFSYRIIGEIKFNLEVMYKGHVWTKAFDYVTDAFEIGEAAYRLLIVYPRVMEEGEVLHEKEVGSTLDVGCYELHRHCLDDKKGAVEILCPPRLVLKGKHIEAIISRCSDGNFLLNVVHTSDVNMHESVLDRSFAYFELAELIARGYLQCADLAKFPSQLHTTYNLVRLRSMH
jgi:hypothetical protein